MACYDRINFESSVIEPILLDKPRELPRGDDPHVLKGIAWPLRSGARLAALPKRYGATMICHNRKPLQGHPSATSKRLEIAGSAKLP